MSVMSPVGLTPYVLGPCDHAVFGTAGHKLVVRPQTDHPAPVEDQDPVGIHHGTDPLGHDHADRTAGLLLKCQTQFPVGLVIQCGEAVVEHVDVRTAAYRPGDGEPLLLPAGKVPAVLGYVRIKPSHGPDEILRLGGPEGVPDVLVAPFPRTRAVVDVLSHGGVEQDRVLRGVAQMLPVFLDVVFPDVLPVHHHPSGVGTVEPHQEVHDGGLPAPGWADDSQRLAR